MEQIGLNVLNAKCLETGILSSDNPPYGFNTDVGISQAKVHNHIEFVLYRNRKSSLEYVESKIIMKVSTTMPPTEYGHPSYPAAHTGRPVCW